MLISRQKRGEGFLARLEFWRRWRRRNNIAGDNTGMDVGEQLAGEIIEALRSGRDVFVYDEYIHGPDRLERAREVLREKRAACLDPEETAFVTSILRGLEESSPPGA